jgi:16S rRNA (cytosine967-C5)-methyltransferase
MKHFSHLNSAVALLQLYTGEQPFHHFIKDFFRQHKKYGSRDRKSISHLAYSYFRLGHALKKKTIEERIIAGLFLCSQQPNEWLETLRPEWNPHTASSLQHKCGIIGIDATELTIFPWTNNVSDGIDKPSFNLSHLQQPGFFIRIRPGHKKTVVEKLIASAVPYQLKDDNCILLSNATNIDAVLSINKEVVIQDYSSQRVASLLSAVECPPAGCTVWDCCAASGGKSILAKDILGNIALTVSDIRPSIIANLKKRFAEAGIADYQSFVADLSKTGSDARLRTSDSGPAWPASRLIIADVPCTGSGTWGRTPEQLLYFNEKEINRYQALQQKIMSNITAMLQKDGYLLYITCSVFKQENEEMVDLIRANTSLSLLGSEVLKGYEDGADTMFAALFKNK